MESVHNVVKSFVFIGSYRVQLYYLFAAHKKFKWSERWWRKSTPGFPLRHSIRIHLHGLWLNSKYSCHCYTVSFFNDLLYCMNCTLIFPPVPINSFNRVSVLWLAVQWLTWVVVLSCSGFILLVELFLESKCIYVWQYYLGTNKKLFKSIMAKESELHNSYTIMQLIVIKPYGETQVEGIRLRCW